jgi:hypothetical protein
MKTGNGSQHGRFATTTRAEQRNKTTGRDMHIQRLYGCSAVVAAVDTNEIEQFCHRANRAGETAADDNKSESATR